MTFAEADLSHDDFLNGKIVILQPRGGYRAATDPVFLAAAVPARPGQSVLELGCGAGVAIACLCQRLELDAVGLEIQPDYAELAARNAAQNNLDYTVVQGDISAMPATIRARSFDHVMMNPPFFDPTANTSPADSGKRTAHLEGAPDLDEWVIAGLRRLKPKGWLTIIHRAERLSQMLSALQTGAGNIHVLPITSRQGRAAKRVIILAQKAAKAPLQLLPPFIVHDGEHHSDAKKDYGAQATGILRHGDALRIIAQ